MIKREQYINNISTQLTFLQLKAQNDSTLNLQNTNVLAEDFYCHFLNIIYDWQLSNANSSEQNMAGFDLIDKEHKLFVQVSVTRTPEKIRHSLKEIGDNNKYEGYHFKFLSVAKRADNLRKGSFDTPNTIIFVPQNDVMDVQSLLQEIMHTDINRLKELNDLVDQELGVAKNAKIYSSGLGYIVEQLSKIELGNSDSTFDFKEYQIEEKIAYNNIGYWEDIINDYKVYVNQLRNIYSDYDQLGKNKSLSIQDTLKTIYRRNKCNKHGEELFNTILEEIYNILSIEQTTMSEEEVKLYLKVILVDAFIECQIFEKPI